MQTEQVSEIVILQVIQHFTRTGQGYHIQSGIIPTYRRIRHHHKVALLMEYLKLYKGILLSGQDTYLKAGRQVWMEE